MHIILLPCESVTLPVVPSMVAVLVNIVNAALFGGKICTHYP